MPTSFFLLCLSEHRSCKLQFSLKGIGGPDFFLCQLNGIEVLPLHLQLLRSEGGERAGADPLHFYLFGVHVVWTHSASRLLADSVPPKGGKRLVCAAASSDPAGGASSLVGGPVLGGDVPGCQQVVTCCRRCP